MTTKSQYSLHYKTRPTQHNWTRWVSRDTEEQVWDEWREVKDLPEHEGFTWEVQVLTITKIEPPAVWEKGKFYTFDYDKNTIKAVWECIYVWGNGRAVLVHADGDDMVARANNRYDYTEA